MKKNFRKNEKIRKQNKQYFYAGTERTKQKYLDIPR